MLLDPDGPTYQSSTAEAQRERKKKKGRSKSKASIYFITPVTAPENIIEPIEILSKMFSKKKKYKTPPPQSKKTNKKTPQTNQVKKNPQNPKT